MSAPGVTATAINITYDRSVPTTERRWIGRTIRRCFRLWGVSGWDVVVAAKGPRGPREYASIDYSPTAHVARVKLRRARLADRAAAKADLVHELWHIVTDGMEDIFQTLASNIPSGPRRDRMVKRAHRRWEAHHDQTARMWLSVL